MLRKRYIEYVYIYIQNNWKQYELDGNMVANSNRTKLFAKKKKLMKTVTMKEKCGGL